MRAGEPELVPRIFEFRNNGKYPDLAGSIRLVAGSCVFVQALTGVHSFGAAL